MESGGFGSQNITCRSFRGHESLNRPAALLACMHSMHVTVHSVIFKHAARMCGEGGMVEGSTIGALDAT